MPRMPLLRAGLIVPVLVLLQPTRSVDYAIQIENTMGHEMDFFYSDTDSTEHALGTIPPYLIQKYVIKSPARTSIVIIERGSAMGDYEMKKPVDLVADSVVSVTF
jgi:hypothetical protein